MKQLSLGVLGVLLASGALAAQGSFLNLGAALEPAAVSGDGALVVGYSGGEFFVWTAGTGATLVGGVSPASGAGGQGSLSFDGSVLGGTVLNTGNGLWEAGRYDLGAASWMPLGSLGASSGGSASSGWGLSGDGQVSVGLVWVNAGTAHGFTWSAATGLVDLGSSVANRSTRANACDYDGNVVVGWQDGLTGFRQGAVWKNGVQTLITLGANPMSELDAVSADGVWAGGLGGANGGQAYLWSAGTGVISLGHLNPAYKGGVTGISADGRVVVGYDRPNGPALLGRGFVWTPTTGMLDINTVAANAGINVGAAVLSLPLAVSADGRTIVGQGLSGGPIGWVLHLPEPSCGGVGYGYGASLANELVLSASGNPAIGGTATLVVSNAAANSAFLGLSSAASSLPFGDGVVLIDLNNFFGVFPMLPGAGGAVFSAPIANDPNLVGMSVFGQAAAVEPSQAGLLAYSNGIKLTVCP